MNSASPVPNSQPSRFTYGSSVVLGLGMFGISLASGIYNSYVPLFLRFYIPSVAVIGLIASVRTLMGVILNMYFSARSDRVRTRFGRRLPYILIGMPITGLLFIAFPWQISATFLVSIDIIYAFASNVFYAPEIALMPDVTPVARRSQAYGIINGMGGAAALLAFFVGPTLFHIGRQIPFLLVGILFFIIPAVMYWKIKEPRDAPLSTAVGFRHLYHAARDVVGRSDKTALWLLVGAFFWTGGESSIESFFVTYGVYHLHIASGIAVITIGLFALTYLIFAVPSGFLTKRVSQRRLILMGTAGMALSFASMAFFDSIWPIRILALAGGLFWALVQVNGYPWFTTLAGPAGVGAFTGLWLMSGGLGDLFWQPAIGFLMDHFSYPWLFYGAGGAIGLGCVAILQTRRVARVSPSGEGV